MTDDPPYRSVWRSASGELARVLDVSSRARRDRPPLRVVRLELVVEGRSFGYRIFLHREYLRRLALETFRKRYPERVA